MPGKHAMMTPDDIARLRAIEDHAKACEATARTLDHYPGMSAIADYWRVCAAWWRAFSERAGR
jgi:hypothetical protein